MNIITIIMAGSLLAAFAKLLGLQFATYSYTLALSPIYFGLACLLVFGIFAGVMEYLSEKSKENRENGN